MQQGYDIRTIRELLGHKDMGTTMIYTHVLNRGGRGAVSPLDRQARRSQALTISAIAASSLRNGPAPARAGASPGPRRGGPG